jgi:hypothetical protein
LHERPERFERGVRTPLPGVERERLLAESVNRCFYCGAEAEHPEMDHVFPVALGGTSDPWNFVVACADCNRKKGARNPWEFLDGQPLRPTAEQISKVDDIEQRLNRRRLRREELIQVQAERAARRAEGVGKAAETRRRRREEEEAPYRAHIVEVLRQKNLFRASLGLPPLPTKAERIDGHRRLPEAFGHDLDPLTQRYRERLGELRSLHGGELPPGVADAFIAEYRDDLRRHQEGLRDEVGTTDSAPSA